MKKLFAIIVAGLFSSIAFAQTFPSPTFNSLTLQNPLSVSSGGSGASSSTGAGSLVLSTSPTIASPTVTGSFTATGLVTPADLATQAANTVLSNVTGSSASPTAFTMPSCSTANSALKYTLGSGWACGTTYALTGSTLAQFATTTSAQLASIIPDETGSGAAVFGTGPTINSPQLSGAPVVSGAAGTFRGLTIDTGTTSSRWFMYADATAESGSNAGSNFGINAYSDAGAFLSEPIQITRATGVVQFSSPPTVNGSAIYPTVSNNSGLQGLSTVTTSTVTRLGFTTAGDAPPLTYTASASACSLNSGAGDNGSQVQSANGKCWIASFPSGRVDVREFGAKPDGATNDTSAMQAAHNTGKLIYYPAGTYNFTTISFSAGGIVGDGYFSVLNSTDATSSDLILFTGNTVPAQVPTFSNFFLQALNTKAAGAGLHISPATGTLEYVHIDQIFIYNAPRGVQLTNCDFGSLEQSSIVNYTDSGVYYEFPANTGAGDFLISGNHIGTSQSSGNRNGVFQQSGGGLRIIGNKILGGGSGFVLNYTGSIASGPLLLNGNSIENQINFSIFLGTGSTGTFGGIEIVGNELGVLNGTNGSNIATDTNGKLSLLAISGNYMAFNAPSGSALSFNGVQGFSIGPNIVVGNNGASNFGFLVTSSNSNGKISPQTFFNIPAANRLSNASTSVSYEEPAQNIAVGTITTSSAYGSLFEGSVSASFSHAYSIAPAVTCNLGNTTGGGISANAANVTTTGFTVFAVGTTSAGSLTGVTCVAAGGVI